MRLRLVILVIAPVLLFPSQIVAATLVSNTETIAQANKLESLEYQLTLLDQTNNKILNTVYWALGGLITVFLTIVGLNFFQNFSLNKSKFEALKKETESSIESEKEKLGEEVRKLSVNEQEQNKKFFGELDVKIDSKVKLSVERSLKNFQNEIKKIQEEYEDVKRDNLIRKAFEHKAKGQMGYILNLIEALELDIKKGYDWQINESLDRISRCLEEGYKDSSSMAKLNDILGKLPITYNFQKKSLESKMVI